MISLFKRSGPRLDVNPPYSFGRIAEVKQAQNRSIAVVRSPIEGNDVVIDVQQIDLTIVH